MSNFVALAYFVLSVLLGTVTGKRLASHLQNAEPLSKTPSELRAWARDQFARRHYARSEMVFARTGNESLLEQAFQFFKANTTKHLWKQEWFDTVAVDVQLFEDFHVEQVEWLELVLLSVIQDEKNAGLECLRFGRCHGTGAPQYLLEALPSGDVIPLLHFERRHGDRSWSHWMSRNFAAFARESLEKVPILERFNFLGQWMARAYVISGISFAPVSFHSIIYESLIAGHPLTPSPIPNAYQEDDTIQECEWLAGIYGSRRPQELGTYGWQSCDESQDPESGRYTQESCYKPLYRSKEMWEMVGARWGQVAPQGSKTDDPVPFEQASEFTKLKCTSSWVQDFKVPVDAMVKGFRQVIPDPTFWKQVDRKALKHLVEGDSEINVARMIEASEFEGQWTDAQKQVLLDTLHDLRKKGKGLPFQNTLNKLLHFFTGSYKEPVNGWKQVRFLLGSDGIDGTQDKQLSFVPLTGKKNRSELQIPEDSLKNSSALAERIQHSMMIAEGLGSTKSTKPLTLIELQELARQKFQMDDSTAILRLSDTGEESIFEQTKQFFASYPGWHSQWDSGSEPLKVRLGRFSMVTVAEWTALVLRSVVQKSRGDGLQCLKFGTCAGASSPQYLLEALPSGDVIPLLSFEREDRCWSDWRSRDGGFAAESCFQVFAGLERFNFLGQWMARAYMISESLAPVSLHSTIYQSLVAGYAVTPLPIPHAYQDADTIQECEWLAGIYGSRRPQELGTYGWQSCDESQDQSGRYTQDSCYKPLYRSKEMWGDLQARWGPLALQGSNASDPVPFERAREYTVLKCRSKWEQDFKAPVTALVKGFRQVVSDLTFWREVDSKSLKRLVEGDPEINVKDLISNGTATFSGGWTGQQIGVVSGTLYELDKKGKGLPPFQNTLNKLLHFFTGSYKEPAFGFKDVTFERVDSLECSKLVGKTSSKTLRIPSGCLTNITTFEDAINKAVVSD